MIAIVSAVISLLHHLFMSVPSNYLTLKCSKDTIPYTWLVWWSRRVIRVLFKVALYTFVLEFPWLCWHHTTSCKLSENLFMLTTLLQCYLPPELPRDFLCMDSNPQPINQVDLDAQVAQSLYQQQFVGAVSQHGAPGSQATGRLSITIVQVRVGLIGISTTPVLISFFMNNPIWETPAGKWNPSLLLQVLWLIVDRVNCILWCSKITIAQCA